MIHDTDYEQGKRSAIFDIEINKEGIVEKLTLTPTYIKDKKKTVRYTDISEKNNNEYLERFKKESTLKDYSSYIEKGKIMLKRNK